MPDIHIRGAAGAVAGENMISADQVTIRGNGTKSDPLRSVPSIEGGTFEAACRSESPVPGMPVFASFVSEPGGIATVQVTDVRAEEAGLVGEFKAVIGLVQRVNDSGTVQVQSSGVLTLTTAQWDEVAASFGGGLLRGRAYYPSTTTGLITRVPPAGPGEYVTRIGTALGPRTMLIQPQAPVQNLADLILFARSPTPLTLGMAVYVVEASGQVQPADQDVSVDRATAIGVVAGFDVNSQPIVQLGGVVQLTETQWDVVAGGLSGPGLRRGHAYYVDTQDSPGHITTMAPLIAAKVQVGIAMSSTRLLLSGPFLQRL